MKRLPILAVALLTLGGLAWMTGNGVTPATAQYVTMQVAAAQTATFSIENMTCALCPVTVKKAMEGVPGVKSVTVDFDTKTAIVVFDPSITTSDAIAAASTNVGYPASVQG
ncbi:MAG: cation transporter [Rhodospirillales bacterium]|nr:cation transporter [Rhodospirillales bacterium]